MRAASIAVSASMLAFAAIAGAAVHRVPSEYATIQAGIDAAAEGDTVLVAPGTYTGVGNRDLNFHGTNLMLCSMAGPKETVIDCETETRGITFESGESSASRLSGFTIRSGEVWGNGGGVLCDGASPTFWNLVIADCRALDGSGWSAGGGMCLYDSQSTLDGVSFIGNLAYVFYGEITCGQGGGLASFDSSIELRDVTFLDNDADSYSWLYIPEAEGGGLYADGGSVVIERALFARNSNGGYTVPTNNGFGSALRVNGQLVLRNVSIVDNPGGGAVLRCDGMATLEQVLIAHNHVDRTVFGYPADFSASCCNVYANFGGDYDEDDGLHGLLGIDGNISLPPHLCNVSQGNYHLQADSPCLPANNSCGVLIGAFGAGCEETPVLLASFTATPVAGAVDFAWEADALADFRLTGTRDFASWDVAWQAAGAGRFHARDESGQLAPGGEISYRLEGRLPGEDWQLLREIAVLLPPAFVTRLLAPHPNPFNPTVTLPFTLAAPGRVRLAIFDLAGRRITTLADGHFEAGEQALTWDGRDAAGQPQASGVYFARFVAAGKSETKRLVLLR